MCGCSGRSSIYINFVVLVATNRCCCDGAFGCMDRSNCIDGFEGGCYVAVGSGGGGSYSGYDEVFLISRGHHYMPHVALSDTCWPLHGNRSPSPSPQTRTAVRKDGIGEGKATGEEKESKKK